MCRSCKPAAVRLTRLVGLDKAATAVYKVRRAAGVQVLAADGRRRLNGRDRILRGQREQRLRRFGRMTDPSAIDVMVMVMVAVTAVMMITLVMVMVVQVLMVMMIVTVAIVAFDILQLQVNRTVIVVQLPARAAVGGGRDLMRVAIQVLVAEPVTTERLGRQVVPRLDGLHGGARAIPLPVRGRRLRLDRVLSRRTAGRRLHRHRVFVPIQRVSTQRRRVRRRTVLGQAVLVSAAAATTTAR